MSPHTCLGALSAGDLREEEVRANQRSQSQYGSHDAWQQVRKSLEQGYVPQQRWELLSGM